MFSAAKGIDKRLFLTFLLHKKRGVAYDLSNYLQDYVKRGWRLYMITIIYDVYVFAVIIAAAIRIIKIIRNITKK